MKNYQIKLVKNTISNSEIDSLCDWLKTYPQLTKGKQCEEFERIWCEHLGTKYCIFVNSGSSANLAALYSLLLSGKLKNNKIIAPAISWATTVSPIMQLKDLEPILCEASKEDLGIDPDSFEKLCKTHNPAAVILVHVLGVPNNMNKIMEISKKYNVLIIEDSCESVDSLYDGKKTGTFGLLSTFSTYYGHHFSTIEGGIVCTDDPDLNDICRSIRAHGWARDVSEKMKNELKEKHNINDFRNLYSMYFPGFNFRPTEIQSFLGISQMKNIKEICLKRNNNFNIYHENIKNSYWKIAPDKNSWISNFAYPIIHPNIHKIVENLNINSIECRPLVCGSISRQPFFYEKYGKQKFDFADIVHDYGMYLPNNPDMTKEDILRVCNIVNKSINGG